MWRFVSGTGSSLGSGFTGSAHPGHHGADDSRGPKELLALPTSQRGIVRSNPEL